MVRYDLNLFEVWEPVPGFEGLYDVSSEGRVWSIRNKLFLKQRRDKGGYQCVYLSKCGKTKCCLVHRLVAQTFISNIYGFPQINHKDEDKSNNTVSNLEWCTAQYNSNYGGRNIRIHNTKVLNNQISGLSRKEWSQKWRQEHKQHLCEYWRNYRSEHKEEYNAYIRNRRQNKKNQYEYL